MATDGAAEDGAAPAVSKGRHIFTCASHRRHVAAAVAGAGEDVGPRIQLHHLTRVVAAQGTPRVGGISDRGGSTLGGISDQGGSTLGHAGYTQGCYNGL